MDSELETEIPWGSGRHSAGKLEPEEHTTRQHWLCVFCYTGDVNNKRWTRSCISSSDMLCTLVLCVSIVTRQSAGTDP